MPPAGPGDKAAKADIVRVRQRLIAYRSSSVALSRLAGMDPGGVVKRQRMGGKRLSHPRHSPFRASDFEPTLKR